MKKVNQICFALTLAIVATFSSTSIMAQVSANVKEGSSSGNELVTSMATLTKNYQNAYNREDTKTLVGMYASQVAIVGIDGTTATISRDEIKGSLENDFIIRDEEIEINLGNAFQLPDGKVRITGTFSTSETDPKTGVVTKQSGIFDHVLTNEAGVWKISQMESIPNK